MLDLLETNRPPIDNSSIRVLIVEADDWLTNQVKSYLEEHGLAVDSATNSSDGLEAAFSTSPDVVLISLRLPGLDGVQLCQRLRSRRAVPIILFSDNAEEADCVLGLESGADDCLSRGISPRELLARVRAQVRRYRNYGSANTREVKVGPLRLDPSSMSATLHGLPLNLTAYEFGLLRTLAERAGRVLSREQLMDMVSGNSSQAFDRTIDVHISRLRQKLGDDPRHPRRLKTVRGAGYLYSP